METKSNTEERVPKFCGLLTMTEYFDDENKCIKYFTEKRWPDGVCCPRCHHAKVFKFKDGKRYKCAKCKEHFNYKTDTIFENSKISLRKWLTAIYLVTAHKKGVSSHQLARDIEVTQKTAWFMLHRIRYSLNKGIYEEMLGDVSGIVEMDETFVGGKNKNRHKDKKVPQSKGRAYRDKTPVIGLLERGGRLKAFALATVKQTILQPYVEKQMYADINLITDEYWLKSTLNKTFNHYYVNHSAKQYANGDVHTNSIEGFWAHLKRSLSGIYHRVSRRHLQRYVDEATFKFNTRKLNEFQRTNVVLGNASHRLTYKSLTTLYGKKAEKNQFPPPK